MRTVLTQTKLATVSFACYYRITRRRSGAGPPRNKCTPVYITHQMNAQRARLRPAYYSLATAGGANKIRSSTWVLSDTNRLATVQPHSAVHEQTASLQPHPKGLPINAPVLFLQATGRCAVLTQLLSLAVRASTAREPCVCVVLSGRLTPQQLTNASATPAG